MPDGSKENCFIFHVTLQIAYLSRPYSTFWKATFQILAKSLVEHSLMAPLGGMEAEMCVVRDLLQGPNWAKTLNLVTTILLPYNIHTF